MKFLDHKELNRQFDEFKQGKSVGLAGVRRKEAFDENPDRPGTVKYALGLNRILEKSFTPVFAGDLLPGVGFFGMLAQADHPDAGKDEEEPARRFGTYADHHAPGYEKLLKLGFKGLKKEASDSRLRYSDKASLDFLESVLTALEGASAYMNKWAARLSETCGDVPEFKKLQTRLSGSFAWLAENPPRSFHEAVILVYSFHCMMQMDQRYAMAFGRMDQYLFPFYITDIEKGFTDKETAQTVLDHFITKITITEDVQNICVGGVDSKGENAVNELSYMILEACRRVGKAGGNVTARISACTPDCFLEKCAEVIGSGVGYPALFNDDIEIPALVENGYSLEDARNYCFVGCIEIFIPGKSAPWTDTRFNLLKCVNLVLFNGVDSLTGESAGLETGEPATWEEFYQAYQKQLRFGMDEHADWKNRHDTEFEKNAYERTSPLMSTLTESCVEQGIDISGGGALYPSNVGVGGMGIGSTADSLSAIRKFVYEDGTFTLENLRTFCRADFNGYERERKILIKGAPKYGNDDEFVDEIARDVSRDFGRECLRHRTVRGGQFWGLMAANINNIGAGKEVGATPDGRHSLTPLSDAASPTFGRDTHGPTAVIKSISKLPYNLCPGGNVINMKLHMGEDENRFRNLVSLVRACFKIGGIQLQFNTVDRETLRKAMECPEEYRDLVVRVSGFSAQFIGLAPAVQEDILSRTEHSI